MDKLAFIDLETTGLDVHRHSVWEIGLVVRENGFDTAWEWQVEADLSTADPKSLAMAHFYERRLPVPYHGHSVAPQLARLLAGSVLVGINVWFDRDFADTYLRSYNEALVADYHLVEICSLVTGYLHGRQEDPPKSRSSNELAKAVGIDHAQYERHSALADAYFARDIYDAVTGR